MSAAARAELRPVRLVRDGDAEWEEDADDLERFDDDDDDEPGAGIVADDFQTRPFRPAARTGVVAASPLGLVRRDHPAPTIAADWEATRDLADLALPRSEFVPAPDPDPDQRGADLLREALEAAFPAPEAALTRVVVIAHGHHYRVLARPMPRDAALVSRDPEGFAALVAAHGPLLIAANAQPYSWYPGDRRYADLGLRFEQGVATSYTTATLDAALRARRVEERKAEAAAEKRAARRRAKEQAQDKRCAAVTRAAVALAEAIHAELAARGHGAVVLRPSGYYYDVTRLPAYARLLERLAGRAAWRRLPAPPARRPRRRKAGPPPAPPAPPPTPWEALRAALAALPGGVADLKRYGSGRPWAETRAWYAAELAARPPRPRPRPRNNPQDPRP